MLALAVITVCLASAAVATRTHMVYWNTTNPIFRIDNTDHIVDVNEGTLPWEYDQLDLICPQNSLEQHIVYSVSRQEFESCRVTNPEARIVAMCNKPQDFNRVTITFRSFSPTPGGLEFKPGQSYYFISTSTKRDLLRRVGGFCASHNMKMVFRVAEREERPAVNTEQRMVYNNPLYTAFRTSSARPTTTTTSTKTPPVYHYKSRTPSVHTSDYIYYYSPRDLVQLKLAARKHSRKAQLPRVNSENDVLKASRLTGGAAGGAATALCIALAALACCLL